MGTTSRATSQVCARSVDGTSKMDPEIGCLLVYTVFPFTVLGLFTVVLTATHRASGAYLLFIWWTGICVVEGFFHGRTTSGFTRLDYALMCSLPIWSFLIRKRCSYKPLHFTYGALGGLMFLDAYTWRPVEWDLWVFTSRCVAFSIFMGCVCRLVSSVRFVPRHKPGHCQKCGYDLIGNVSGVCPECGTKIEHT